MRCSFLFGFLSLEFVVSLAQEHENPSCNPGPCVDPEILKLETSECQKYHIFIARGSDSGYPGHLGPLAGLVCKELEDCGYENIVYPANSQFAGEEAWCKSANKGAVNGQKQMKSYAERCPDSKLLLFGFSQGGSVAFDILGGGGGPGFGCLNQPDNPPLDRSEVPGSKIAAAIIFGAVVRSADQEFTLEDGLMRNGVSPRDFNGTRPRRPEYLAALNKYSDILIEYCNVKDPVCAKGGPDGSIEDHLNYFDLYDEKGAKWVVATASGKKQTTGAGETTDGKTKEVPGGSVANIAGEPSKTRSPPSVASSVLSWSVFAFGLMVISIPFSYMS